MAIHLTESAATQIRNHLEARGKGLGLRLGIKETGCSGYAYVVDYAEEVGPDDVTFDDQGVTVVVDRNSLTLIDGTEVDYVRHGLNEVFRFKNPNSKDECGCGESFNV